MDGTSWKAARPEVGYQIGLMLGGAIGKALNHRAQGNFHQELSDLNQASSGLDPYEYETKLLDLYGRHNREPDNQYVAALRARTGGWKKAEDKRTREAVADKIPGLFPEPNAEDYQAQGGPMLTARRTSFPITLDNGMETPEPFMEEGPTEWEVSPNVVPFTASDRQAKRFLADEGRNSRGRTMADLVRSGAIPAKDVLDYSEKMEGISSKEETAALTAEQRALDSANRSSERMMMEQRIRELEGNRQGTAGTTIRGYQKDNSSSTGWSALLANGTILPDALPPGYLASQAPKGSWSMEAARLSELAADIENPDTPENRRLAAQDEYRRILAAQNARGFKTFLGVDPDTGAAATMGAQVPVDKSLIPGNQRAPTSAGAAAPQLGIGENARTTSQGVSPGYVPPNAPVEGARGTVLGVKPTPEPNNPYESFRVGYKQDHPEATESQISTAWEKKELDRIRAGTEARKSITDPFTDKEVSAIAEGIYEGKVKPDYLTARGPMRAAVVSYLQRFHPDYDLVQLQSEAAAATNVNLNKAKAILESIVTPQEGETSSLLANFKAAHKKLGFGKYPAANKAKRIYLEQTGSGAITEYDNYRNNLAMELGNALAAAALTDSRMRVEQENLAKNPSAEQIDHAIGVLEKIVGARLSSFRKMQGGDRKRQGSPAKAPQEMTDDELLKALGQ